MIFNLFFFGKKPTRAYLRIYTLNIYRREIFASILDIRDFINFGDCQTFAAGHSNYGIEIDIDFYLLFIIRKINFSD